MTKTKTLVFPAVATYQPRQLAWTGVLTVLAVIVPVLLAHTIQNQWIVGTLVNCLLFLAAIKTGVLNASLVAVAPSAVAFARGLLPAILAPAIPYIIVSNILLVVVVAVLHRSIKSSAITIAAASLVKFLFLIIAASLFLAPVVAGSPLVFMLGMPQLFTAIAGGLLAMFILKT